MKTPVDVLPSIRRRLSRVLMVVSIAWGIAVSATVWFAVRHEVDELLDNTLQESAEILFGLLSFNASQLPLHGGGSLPAPLHEENTVWQIVSPDHEVLLRSHRAPMQALADRRTAGLSSLGDKWHVYSLPFDASGRMLCVAQATDERQEARLDAAGFAASGALIVGVLCAFLLRWRVRRELEPITALSQAVTQFDPLRPEYPLEESTRAELMPMHTAITELGARLARQLANERAFSAHAAHALRTPLAGMVAQLAVAQRISPPEAQPQLQRAREAADRLRRVVTALLTLFRAGGDVERQPVAMADLMAQLPFERLAITANGDTHAQVDPDLLAAALMNLLDNSMRHGATQARVDTRHESDGRTVVSVRDNGSGIPEVERTRLQAALDAQQYEDHTGLGLMLADLVARAHGGRLHLRPASAGGSIEIDLGITSAR
ncbi:MAG: HAMP domain-containing sensor histidine kinase [Pseudomonadota bacterium]|nr:HAMP domain-containing sensor histidine kinase [Pseudomonadota bacterium]